MGRDPPSAEGAVEISEKEVGEIGNGDFQEFWNMILEASVLYWHTPASNLCVRDFMHSSCDGSSFFPLGAKSLTNKCRGDPTVLSLIHLCTAESHARTLLSLSVVKKTLLCF